MRRTTNPASRLILCYFGIHALRGLAAGDPGLPGGAVASTSTAVTKGLEAYARLCLRLFAEPLHGASSPRSTGSARSSAAGDRITVLAASGKVIGDSQEDPGRSAIRLDRPEIVEALAGSVGYSSEAAENSGNEWTYVAIPRGTLRHGAGCGAACADGRQGRGALHGRCADVCSAAVAMCACAVAVPVGSLPGGSAVRWKRWPRSPQGFGGNGPLPRFTARNSRRWSGWRRLNEMTARLQERIQTSLRQQGQQEAMLSSMAHGILAFDRDGTILSANDTCGTLLGIDAAKLRGRAPTRCSASRICCGWSSRRWPADRPWNATCRSTARRSLAARPGTPLYDAQRQQIGGPADAPRRHPAAPPGRRSAATSWPMSRTN